MLKDVKEALYGANGFGCGLMHEFAITAAKNGWSPQDMDDLAKNSDLMKLFRGVIRGTHKIDFIPHVIDCDVLPSVENGYEIFHHQKMDHILFDSTLFGFTPFQYDSTKVGYHILESLKGSNFLVEQVGLILNANVLDYLLLPENQILIPKFWREISSGKHFIHFFGTFYKKEDELFVRSMYWGSDGKWLSRYESLKYSDFSAHNSSAIVLK